MNLDKIKILKGNSYYRIGDLVLGLGNRHKKDRRAIQSKDIYKGTILQKYLTELKKSAGKKINFKLLKEICDAHPPVYTPRDQLLVHVRSGDVALCFDDKQMANEPWAKRYLDTFILNPQRFLKAVEANFTSEIKTINIVTAMHYGSNYDDGRFFFSEKSYEKNIEILSGLAGLLEDKFKIEVEFIVFDLSLCWQMMYSF